ncbi:hypothetical protein [Desulfovibrio intestinalis]|uniref:Uncharacterized protein n=1 Tax=Desulfovibrio intestinalis TaxID=58621 RepID=A0A7W8FGH3_9BACT|nr:hypothetical protein [Desulfovibrio intestinalis]MBB5143916.1 hypothetical protein [Desulfovibrio intestinalis]
MSTQLTPAQELRVFDKALDALAFKVAESCLLLDCPNPEKFDPAGKRIDPSPTLCAGCYREWAVNKAMKEMEASHD